MSRYGHRRIGRRDMLKAAGALTAALAALGGGPGCCSGWTVSRTVSTPRTATPPTTHRAEAELQEITYNGRTYRQRPDLETYLLMGVDTPAKGWGWNSYAGGGQADVQIVVVLDDANQTWQMLQLNRTASCRCRCGGSRGTS